MKTETCKPEVWAVYSDSSAIKNQREGWRRGATRGVSGVRGGCICRSNQDEIREIHTMVKIFEDMVVYLNDYYCYLWKQPKRTMKPRDVLDHI